MPKPISDIKTFIETAFADDGLIIQVHNRTINITTPLDILSRLLSFVKEQPYCSFHQLIDIIGIDLFPEKPRFSIVYHLLSMKNNMRISIKIMLEEKVCPTSVASIFPSAGWCEREIFDMYGIIFKDHTDLRRILTEYDFDGYPLRKDFPLFGYRQVRYDEKLGKVVHEPVDLPQMLRDFEFENEWEGPHYPFLEKDMEKEKGNAS